MSSPMTHHPDVSTPDTALQEATTSLSHISLVIDSLNNEVEAQRCVYVKNRMEENWMKLTEITKNNQRLSVERGNLGKINGSKIDNLLTKRQKDAIDMQKRDAISSSQENKQASVILLGAGIAVRTSILPINLPKENKIPPYTTWIFFDRNQKMTDDQSVLGQRRIYYDRNGGEALICSDSEEEMIDHEDHKKQFVVSEDNIIWSTIEQTGESDMVYNLLAQRLSRKPCEIKEQYKSLKSSKPKDADSYTNSFFDQDLEAAQDSFNKLFCRRCLIFDCKLHGCSQELIYPDEKGGSASKSMDDENAPCSPHCYFQLEGNAVVSSPLQINTEQTGMVSSAASGVPIIKEKSCSPFIRKRLKTSSDAQKDIERIDSKTMPVHEEYPTNHSLSSNNKERVRKSVTSGSEEAKEFSSSSLKAKFFSTTQPRRKDSFVPTGNQLVTCSNNTKKNKMFVYDHTFRHITDFESWRTLEKSLYKKGLEIFGRNSCLIARNVMGGRKTCAEVYHVLQYHENKLYSQGSNSINSQDEDDRTESNENMGTARRRRSNFFHRRTRFRRLNYTWKSAGSHPMRKWNSDKNNLHCRQYDPCGCHSVCGVDCTCQANGTCCEKYCGCPKSCKNRFRGCHCAKCQCRSRQCPCFAANRECDPDVCRHCWISCGDGTLGSPGKKGNSYECQNMKLLLRQQQRVLLGRSEVSGWGAFLKNSVGIDEYLGEYTGELISHHEADKRGKIYDRENSSFLFNLNDQYVLDAYRKGDKLKFANHSPDPNCYAKVMMVAGDHRVGIFAKESISAGEELFYDYRYEPDKAPSWAKRPEDYGSRKEDVSSSSCRPKKLA